MPAPRCRSSRHTTWVTEWERLEPRFATQRRTAQFQRLRPPRRAAELPTEVDVRVETEWHPEQFGVQVLDGARWRAPTEVPLHLRNRSAGQRPRQRIEAPTSGVHPRLLSQ